MGGPADDRSAGRRSPAGSGAGARAGERDNLRTGAESEAGSGAPDRRREPAPGPRGICRWMALTYVGVVFNPQPQRVHQCAARRLWDVRYVAGLMTLEEAGQRLRREAQAVSLAQCDVVICLTDGGNGLENCLSTALGGVVRQVQFILDFHHACDHLTEFAKLMWADDSGIREAHGLVS